MGLTVGGVFVAAPIAIAATIYLLVMLTKAKTTRGRESAAAIFLFAVVAGNFLGMAVDYVVERASYAARTNDL